MNELRRGNTFVEPGPAPVRRVQAEIEPWPSTTLPEVAQSRYTVVGTPVQAAAGFAIAYTPVAAGLALVAGLAVAVTGGGMVTVAIATLVTLAVTWLCGYVVTVVVSAAGADVIRVVLGYRFLRHEQRFRHDRQRGER